jgi:hypothetical protein
MMDPIRAISIVLNKADVHEQVQVNTSDTWTHRIMSLQHSDPWWWRHIGSFLCLTRSLALIDAR